MERIEYLEQNTKDYFIESHEFLYTKKFVEQRRKKINLIYNAYYVEYNLVLKDFRIFFENKLKTKFVRNTTLAKTTRTKKYLINKYSLVAKKLRIYKFFDRNFDYRDITMKPNIVFKFKVSKKRQQLKSVNLKPKIMTRRFFYRKLIELEESNGNFQQR